MDEHTHITRRNFLHVAPVAAAAAIPLGLIGGAVVASDAVTPGGEEHPWEKARRLARELSVALAEVRDHPIGGGNPWLAIVRPNDDKMSVMFGDIDSYDARWKELVALSRPASRQMIDAIDQHRCAMTAFAASCPAADKVDPAYEGAKGHARWERLNNIEQKAFRKLLKLKPQTIADVRAKADYLRGKDIDLEGQRDGIALLLSSLANGGFDA